MDDLGGAGVDVPGVFGPGPDTVQVAQVILVRTEELPVRPDLIGKGLEEAHHLLLLLVLHVLQVPVEL